MVDYDFSTLNDKEFEDITLELISRDRGKKYQRFKQGRDGGIDGIFFIDENNEEVVQCKHYLKSGVTQLINKLKNEELEKVKKLAPQNYIFITSLSLSNTELNKIYNLFKPYIKSKNDIYYQEKLNDILKQNKNIEERYYKLWLNNTTVLRRIFNNAIKGRSKFLIDNINANKNKYVLTENHKKASQILEKNKVLILSGEPGIGKTTLANFISLEYVHGGFEFIVIGKSLEEAEDIFDYEKKQLFYFDDFLGATYLEALNDKDSHVMDFIQRVIKSKNKRFILTTRTIIFNQAISLSNSFSTRNIQSKEYLLEVTALNQYEKALILYNHIFFSNLNEEFIDEIYLEKRYLNIIRHKNFNPRLIEFITCSDRMSYTTKNNYWSELFAKIENPSDIWEQTFDKESDEYIRLIVRLVVFNGNELNETKLMKYYQEGIKLEKIHNYTYLSKEFTSVIKHVVKYFLNRTQNRNNTISYTLFNPSIADYIINRYKKDEQKLISTFKSLDTNNSLKVLNDLYRNNDIKKQTYKKILIELYQKIPYCEKEIEGINYSISIIYKVNKLELESPNIEIELNFFYELINNPKRFYFIYHFLHLLEDAINKKKIVIKDFNFIASYIDFSSSDLNNLNSVITFIKNFKLYNEKYIELLEESIINYLSMELDHKISELNSYDVDIQFDSFSETYELTTDLEMIAEEFLDNLIYEIEDYKIFDIDYSYILSVIDFSYIEDNLIDDYIQEESYDWDEDRGASRSLSSKNQNSIESLFER